MRKTVLISGCSTGIGYATAVMLKNNGHQVFATARKEADVTRLSENGLTALQLDVDDSDSIEKCVERVLEKTGGRLDVLINNAAYGLVGALEDISRNALRKQFETNVFGTHQLTNKVLPVMRKHKSGLIINISSVLGLVAMPYKGAYNASKFALEGLTDTLRMELHGTGIHVSLIEPGPITTHFRKNAAQAFTQHVPNRSKEHEHVYDKMATQREQSKSPAFSLPPEAVSKKILKAINSKCPKAHYYVTFPTHLMAALRRILPTCCLDWFIRKVG